MPNPIETDKIIFSCDVVSFSSTPLPRDDQTDLDAQGVLRNVTYGEGFDTFMQQVARNMTPRVIVMFVDPADEPG